MLKDLYSVQTHILLTLKLVQALHHKVQLLDAVVQIMPLLYCKAVEVNHMSMIRKTTNYLGLVVINNTYVCVKCKV